MPAGNLTDGVALVSNLKVLLVLRSKFGIDDPTFLIGMI
jgi:hypothetical protein